MNVQFVTAKGHKGRVYPVLYATKNSYGRVQCLIAKRNKNWSGVRGIPSNETVFYQQEGFDPQKWNRERGSRSSMFDWVCPGYAGWGYAFDNNQDAMASLRELDRFHNDKLGTVKAISVRLNEPVGHVQDLLVLP